jgi:predicted SnoaL-like aldol condensation-catalyzing enzyme
LGGAAAMIERLRAAVDAHDLAALGACFTPDYSNETPAHPARGFRGREQVLRNWAQIFAAMPDIRARLVRSAIDGDTAWSEWEMTGTRPDGSTQTLVGVTIFGVVDGAAAWARFYLEPVDPAALDVDGAIRTTIGPPASSTDAPR